MELAALQAHLSRDDDRAIHVAGLVPHELFMEYPDLAEGSVIFLERVFEHELTPIVMGSFLTSRMLGEVSAVGLLQNSVRRGGITTINLSTYHISLLQAPSSSSFPSMCRLDTA
jgi:hypothetical protein